MHIPQEIAKSLRVILSPDVEKELVTLLEACIEFENTKLGDAALAFDRIRYHQGRVSMLRELVRYRDHVISEARGRE